MKIKVNDYVRTDKGNISKIKWISQQVATLSETKSGIFHLENGEIVHMYYGDIIKSSPNIIDLIEVGDYVNGYQILDIVEVPKRVLYLNDISQKGALIPRKNIKSIVTKEQFEQMKYKIN